MITSTEQFLLLKIMEEASELSHAAAKAAQFGMYDTIIDKDNLAQLMLEFSDVTATLNMLANYKNISVNICPKQLQEKRLKITKYAHVMRDLEKVSSNVVEDLKDLC